MNKSIRIEIERMIMVLLLFDPHIPAFSLFSRIVWYLIQDTYHKTPNKRPLPINAPPHLPDPKLDIFNGFYALSQPKMVRFSSRKKLVEGKNVLFEATKLANGHGRLLGV